MESDEEIKDKFSYSSSEDIQMDQDDSSSNKASSSDSSSSSGSEEEKEDPYCEKEWENEPLGSISPDWLPEFKKRPAKEIPIDEDSFFELFFTEEIFQMIADETNNYARKRVNIRNKNYECYIQNEQEKANSALLKSNNTEVSNEIPKKPEKKEDSNENSNENLAPTKINIDFHANKKLRTRKRKKPPPIIDANSKENQLQNELPLNSSLKENSAANLSIPKTLAPTNELKSTIASTFASESNEIVSIKPRKRGRPKSSKKLTAKEMFLQGKLPFKTEANLKEIEEEDDSYADYSEEDSFEQADQEDEKFSENNEISQQQLSMKNKNNEPELWNNPEYRFVAPKKRPRGKYKKRASLPTEVLERNRQWKDTNANEIRDFIALALLMGIVKKPAFDDYWSKDLKQRTPVFNTVMPRSRFFKILRYLHISKANPSNRSCAVNKHSRLEKVEYLLNYLKEKWNVYQTPNRYLSIDESMIGFKGKIAFRQYIPRKKHQHGIKCWVMADAHTYYVYEVEIYTGKSDLGTCESELAKKVVLDISEKLPPGHILTFDNFFTGLSLLEELYKRGIGGVGTLRKYRKGLPKSFYDIRLPRKYDMVCLKYKQNPSIKAIAWKDAKLVYCMTNYLPFNEKEISKNLKKSKSVMKIKKPQALAEYTQNMNGVDKVDQMASYYSFNRKSFKWWKKVFFYLIEVSISNSYVLYLQNKGEKTMRRKEYRLVLIEKLLSHRRKVGNTPKPLPQKFQHFPHHMDSARQCYWCKNYYEEKKRTQYYCLKCEVPLCILCFKWYHRHFRIIVERELR